MSQNEQPEELEDILLWLYLSALLMQLGNPDREPVTAIEQKVRKILADALSRSTTIH
jgi:NTP pyrophosphatase (non-canonical NTP hydrolase)